jgi:hypothetical protein
MNALLSNEEGFTNTATGFSALKYNIGGDGNTANGNYALYNNIGGDGNTANGDFALSNSTEGNYNTATGSSALSLNTTGNNNTATGYLALSSNTTGHKNTALGRDADVASGNLENATAIGYNAKVDASNKIQLGDALVTMVATSGGLTTGQDALINGITVGRGGGNDPRNTASGNTALYSNTTGNSNTANGNEALYSNTTGYSNTANGYAALYSNTEGAGNTANGNSALYFNTTGNSNTANGYRALYFNTTGYSNTANGYKALYLNTTGSWNTANGYFALSSNNTGSNNTALGYYADVTSGNLTNATAIGYNAKVDVSNTMQLGNTDVTNVKTSGNLSVGNHIAPPVAFTPTIRAHSNSGVGWNGTGVFGGNNASVILGEYGGATSGVATIGGHNTALDAWTDLVIPGGNLGIGTTAPQNKLDVAGKISVSQSAGDEMVLINGDVWTHGEGTQDFGSGGDHFIIASREGSDESAGVYGDGDHLILWSAGDAYGGQPAALIRVCDEDNFNATDTDPFNNSSIKAYLNTAGNWISASDRNRKENIVPLVSSLDKILQVQAYSYDFKQSVEEKEKGSPQSNAIGVIAQEVESIMPEVVEKSDAGDYYVSYTEFIPYLIESTKEQQEMIEQLMKQNETQQQLIEQLLQERK